MTKTSQKVILSFNLSILILVFNPQVNFYYQKASDLYFLSSDVLKDSIIISIPVFFLLFMLLIFSERIFPKKLAVNFFIIITIYTFLSIINPVVSLGDADMKGFTSEINLSKLTINIFTSIIIFYFFIRHISLTNYNLSLMSVLFFLILFLLYLNNSHKIPSSKIDKISLGQKNIIVFSFDGIPGKFINKYFEKYSIFKEDFKDFTLYKSAISHSPATFASIYSEIFGSQNWKQIASTRKDLEFYRDKWFKLEQFSYIDGSYLYGHYSEFDNPNKSGLSISNANQILENDKIYSIFSSIFFISSSMCRIGFCALGEKYGKLEKYILKSLSILKIRIDLGGKKIADHKAFKKILKKIEKSDKAYGAFLGHFNFSHFPIFHDENCKFKRYKAFPATEESMIKQTECIINLMREVIFVLKTEKVYEKSLLVFKSDHGKPRTYYQNNTLRGKPIFNNDNLWGYDRYRPFLMIKYPDEKSKKIKFNNEMFYLSELSKIYCIFGLPDNKVQNGTCDQLENLILKRHQMSGQNKKYIFVPRLTNDFIFDGHDAFENPETLGEMEVMFKEWTVN